MPYANVETMTRAMASPAGTRCVQRGRSRISSATQMLTSTTQKLTPYAPAKSATWHMARIGVWVWPR
jgi:hypothetical protein